MGNEENCRHVLEKFLREKLNLNSERWTTGKTWNSKIKVHELIGK